MNSFAESPNLSWHLLPPRRPQLKSVLCRLQSCSRPEKAADAVVAPVAPAGVGGTPPAAHTAPVFPIRAVELPRGSATSCAWESLQSFQRQGGQRARRKERAQAQCGSANLRRLKAAVGQTPEEELAGKPNRSNTALYLACRCPGLLLGLSTARVCWPACSSLWERPLIISPVSST